MRNPKFCVCVFFSYKLSNHLYQLEMKINKIIKIQSIYANASFPCRSVVIQESTFLLRSICYVMHIQINSIHFEYLCCFLFPFWFWFSDMFTFVSVSVFDGISYTITHIEKSLGAVCRFTHTGNTYCSLSLSFSVMHRIIISHPGIIFLPYNFLFHFNMLYDF